MSPTVQTVYIVDDDASFLTATSRLLLASGFAVKTFPSANDFLAQLDADAPGCVVADMQMPGLNGLELQSALAKTPNPLPLLFLTGHGDIASSVRAMRSGAEDFLEKRAPKEQLLDAVRRALERDAREREAREHRRELQGRFDALSARELEVLSHLLRGRLNKQIAGDLGINERTVKLHRTSIMAKLRVRSITALTQLVQEAGRMGHERVNLP
jgi:FixJ family two-component response regulator